jgi:hypothetical protein
MDFYGGYKMEMGPLRLDFGGCTTTTPAPTRRLGKVDQGEIYARRQLPIGAAA